MRLGSMFVSMWDCTRGRSHLEVHCTACDDPFSGFETGEDDNSRTVVGSEFHLTAHVALGVELYVDVIQSLLFGYS